VEGRRAVGAESREGDTRKQERERTG
jgi:hypothetical protein